MWAMDTGWMAFQAAAFFMAKQACGQPMPGFGMAAMPGTAVARTPFHAEIVVHVSSLSRRTCRQASAARGPAAMPMAGMSRAMGRLDRLWRIRGPARQWWAFPARLKIKYVRRNRSRQRLAAVKAAARPHSRLPNPSCKARVRCSAVLGLGSRIFSCPAVWHRFTLRCEFKFPQSVAQQPLRQHRRWSRHELQRPHRRCGKRSRGVQEARSAPCLGRRWRKTAVSRPLVPSWSPWRRSRPGPCAPVRA